LAGFLAGSVVRLYYLSPMTFISFDCLREACLKPATSRWELHLSLFCEVDHELFHALSLYSSVHIF
jgi:hypothetical protein